MRKGLPDDQQGEGWVLTPTSGSEVRRIGCFLIGLLLIGSSAVRFGDDRLPASATLCLGLAFVLGAFVFFEERKEPADFEGRIGSGLSFPIRAMPWLMAIVGVAAGAGLALVVAAVYLDPDSSVGARIGATIFAGGGSLIALGVTYDAVASRFLRHRMLLLDVDGITCNLPNGLVRVPWHGITGIRAHWTVDVNDRKKKYDDVLSNWLTIQTVPHLVDGKVEHRCPTAGEREPTVDLIHLGTDPELTLAVLRFYLENPEERGELRTVVALDRVAALRQEGVASPHDG